jgi:hypothetical protein
LSECTAGQRIGFHDGHNLALEDKFKNKHPDKRRVTPAIEREKRWRSAIQPVIGYLTNEHRIECNYLAQAVVTSTMPSSPRSAATSTSDVS